MSTAPLDVVEALPPHPQSAACTNCGDERVDSFCARCGEKQPHHHDVTVGHFFHELLHELLHIDSKLFRTMRLLVTRPGELTADYFAGRKTRYITPLRLFLTLFTLQLIVYTIYKPVALYSLATITRISSNPDTMKALDKLAAKKHMTTEVLIEKIDAKWQKNLSLLQLFNLLGSALVLKILYRSKRHFGEHLVFSSHYLAFSYIYAIAIWPIYFFMGITFSPMMIALMVVNMTLMAVYLCVAVRRFYGQSLEKSIAKGLLAWVGTFAVSVVVMQAAAVMAVIQVAKAKV